VGDIFQIDEHDLPWSEYDGRDGAVDATIRYKALTLGTKGVPPVQYVEYAPGVADPVHSHTTGEFFVVTDGELWLDDTCNGPGSVIFVPRDTDYAVRSGDEGARFFRVVVG